MKKPENGWWVIQAEAQAMSKKLMDYDTCQDGDIDTAAELLVKYAGIIEKLTKQRDELLRELHPWANIRDTPR